MDHQLRFGPTNIGISPIQAYFKYSKLNSWIARSFYHNPSHYVIFIISVFYISWTICSRRLAVCLNSQRLHKNRLLSAPLIHSSVTMFALCMFLKFSCDALIYVTFSFGPSNLPISNDVCSNNHLAVSLILSWRGVDYYVCNFCILCICIFGTFSYSS